MSGKFFMAFIFVIMLATQINFCQAMPYSEMYLGGLTVGSTVDEMKRIYGEPSSGKTSFLEIMMTIRTTGTILTSRNKWTYWETDPADMAEMMRCRTRSMRRPT